MGDMEPRIAVDPELLKLVSKLDHFRGLWVAGVGLPPERLLALRRVARMQSVASSCRIAGNKASEGEVASLLSGETPATMEAAELLGYATAIDRRFPFHGPLVTFDEVKAYVADIEARRHALGHEIDGAVIKVDGIADRSTLTTLHALLASLPPEALAVALR